MNQVFFSTALRLALTGWPLVSCKRCLPLPLYKQHQSRRHLAGCISHPLPVRGWDMEEARRVCTHKTNCNSKDKRQLPLSRREQRSIENSGRHWDCCHRAVWARSACGPICGARGLAGWQRSRLRRSSFSEWLTVCQDRSLMPRWVWCDDGSSQLLRKTPCDICGHFFPCPIVACGQEQNRNGSQFLLIFSLIAHNFHL